MLLSGRDNADNYDLYHYVSPYLMRPYRTVGDICRSAGRDDAGTRCAGCSVGDLCTRMGSGRRLTH